MKQQNLFKSQIISEFGGSLLNGRRKTARPLGIRNTNHLVLKAKNPWLLLRNAKRVGEILNKYAQKFGIQIYDFAVHSDHIHICFRVQNREAYRKWIRAVTSMLVQKIKGLKFGLRPWSRIVMWGKAFPRVLSYIQHNKHEAGLIITGLQTVERFEAKMAGHLMPPPQDRLISRQLPTPSPLKSRLIMAI